MSKRDTNGAQGIHVNADGPRLAKADAVIAYRLGKLKAAGFGGIKISRGQLLGMLLDEAHTAAGLDDAASQAATPAAAPPARPMPAPEPARKAAPAASLADELRAARDRGITFGTIAKKAGLDRDRVSHLSRGRTAHDDEASAIRKALASLLPLPPTPGTARS